MRFKSKQSGFTLIETAVTMVLMSIVMGGVVMATQRGLGMFRRSSANSDINMRSGRVLNRLVKELFGAGNLTPDPAPPFGSATLDFQQAQDWQADALVWGPTKRFTFQYAAGELDNGLDDNGNGLIDEGSVVLIDNLGTGVQQQAIIGNGISELLEGELPNGLDDNGNGLRDEAGLSFDVVGDMLTVRVSLERIGPDGNRMVRTQQTSIKLRNQEGP